MCFARKNGYKNKRPAARADNFDGSDLFSIVWLYKVWTTSFFVTYNDLYSSHYIYYETCFIEVIYISFLYAILIDYLPYEIKLLNYNGAIFA